MDSLYGKIFEKLKKKQNKKLVTFRRCCDTLLTNTQRWRNINHHYILNNYTDNYEGCVGSPQSSNVLTFHGKHSQKPDGMQHSIEIHSSANEGHHCHHTNLLKNLHHQGPWITKKSTVCWLPTYLNPKTVETIIKNVLHTVQNVFICIRSSYSWKHVLRFTNWTPPQRSLVRLMYIYNGDKRSNQYDTWNKKLTSIALTNACDQAIYRYQAHQCSPWRH